MTANVPATPPVAADAHARRLWQQLDDLEAHMRALREELLRAIEDAQARERERAASVRGGEYLAAYA